MEGYSWLCLRFLARQLHVVLEEPPSGAWVALLDGGLDGPPVQQVALSLRLLEEVQRRVSLGAHRVAAEASRLYPHLN